MSNQSTGILLVTFVCCVWPGIVAFVAVKAWQRYEIGGWRSVLFGKQITK